MEWNVLHIVPQTVHQWIWFVLVVKTGMIVNSLDFVIQEKALWAKMVMNVLHFVLLDVVLKRCNVMEELIGIIVQCLIFACHLKDLLVMMAGNVQLIVL